MHPLERKMSQTALSAHAFRLWETGHPRHVEKICQGFDIQVTRMTNESIEFDMLGGEASLSNAIRRIMLAEVQTMAIEHVFIVNNTSIIPDEVLAHRLGMLPILADPAKFHVRETKDDADDQNTIVLRLAVTCKQNKAVAYNQKVLSGSLEWLPQGSEMPEQTGCRFRDGQQGLLPPIRPVHKEVLLAVLAPGQEIVLEAHCTKGKGSEHAKWSPVATSWYRLLPEAVLLQDVVGEMANELAREVPGLVTVKSNGKYSYATVGHARNHEVEIEKFRYLTTKEEWNGYIELRKVQDYFLFSIETSGVLQPCTIFREAIGVLSTKLTTSSYS